MEFYISEQLYLDENTIMQFNASSLALTKARARGYHCAN